MPSWCGSYCRDTKPPLCIWTVMLFCSGKTVNCSSSWEPLEAPQQQPESPRRLYYKPVINPYKSSELHYPPFKPLIGVKASQHSSSVATLTEFEACKTSSWKSTDAGTLPNTQPSWPEGDGKCVSFLWISSILLSFKLLIYNNELF